MMFQKAAFLVWAMLLRCTIGHGLKDCEELFLDCPDFPTLPCLQEKPALAWIVEIAAQYAAKKKYCKANLCAVGCGIFGGQGGGGRSLLRGPRQLYNICTTTGFESSGAMLLYRNICGRRHLDEDNEGGGNENTIDGSCQANNVREETLSLFDFIDDDSNYGCLKDAMCNLWYRF